MATALTETAVQRRRIYDGLVGRNRLVAVLRLLVPGAGVALFAVLFGQMMIDALAERFAIGRITLQDDRMVVDTPSYSGVTSDGSTYRVTALSAEAGLAAIDAITLNGATLVINDRAGVETTARASRAELETTSQTVRVAGRTDLATSSGMEGALTGMAVDFKTQTLTASGPVTFSFPGGERLEAGAMRYEGEPGTWTFERVTLTLPATPKAMAP